MVVEVVVEVVVEGGEVVDNSLLFIFYTVGSAAQCTDKCLGKG